jgi:hypothetical protein
MKLQGFALYKETKRKERIVNRLEYNMVFMQPLITANVCKFDLQAF